MFYSDIKKLNNAHFKRLTEVNGNVFEQVSKS